MKCNECPFCTIPCNRSWCPYTEPKKHNINKLCNGIKKEMSKDDKTPIEAMQTVMDNLDKNPEYYNKQ
jgi:hypothetical protein